VKEILAEEDEKEEGEENKESEERIRRDPTQRVALENIRHLHVGEHRVCDFIALTSILLYDLSRCVLKERSIP